MSTAPAATRAGSRRADPDRPGAAVLAGLVAVLLAVLVLTVAAAPPAVAAVASATPADAAPPPVVPGLVTATASCLAPDPRDTVAVEVAGGRRALPVEACGNRVGTRVDVRVAAADAAAGGAPTAGEANEVARVAGTGSDGAAPDGSTPASTRLSVLLAIIAAVGGASLLVAVGRERRRGSRTPATAGVPVPVPRRSAGEPPRR